METEGKKISEMGRRRASRLGSSNPSRRGGPAGGAEVSEMGRRRRGFVVVDLARRIGQGGGGGVWEFWQPAAVRREKSCPGLSQILASARSSIYSGSNV